MAGSAMCSALLCFIMIANVCSEEQARRMVNEHLLNESEFWGEYVIPSVSRNDPAYNDYRDGEINNYWRGRIWGPTNFLVSEGLKRCGFYREAHLFAKRSINVFRKEWEEYSHIHENYDADTGEGCDVYNSDVFYHFGALLAYLGVQELIDVEPWGGIRFGNLYGGMNEVRNFIISNLVSFFAIVF